MIGYTEGIFSVISLIFLILLSNLKLTTKISIKLIYILLSVFILSLLLSLTRPFLLQVTFSASFALISLLIINKFKNNLDISRYLRIYGLTTFIICLGALVGYCIYGYYCANSRMKCNA